MHDCYLNNVEELLLIKKIIFSSQYLYLLSAQTIDQAEKDKEEKKRYLIRKVCTNGLAIHVYLHSH